MCYQVTRILIVIIMICSFRWSNGKCNMSPYTVVILASAILSAEAACRPEIADSTNFTQGYKKLECEVSSCESISKIIYQKTIKYKWTPVYQGVSSDKYYPLDTENYQLSNRTDYASFKNKKILYIKPKLLGDQGEWKCVVYDKMDVAYDSVPIAVHVYRKPEGYPLILIPKNSSVVTGQSAEFICIAYLMYPEPDVVWKVNNLERANGTSDNQKNEDGLWIVMNIINIVFNVQGVHNLSCVIKTRELDPWVTHSITIDVKEPASIINPSESIVLLASNDETFELNCTGSGYKPDIIWKRDGENIPSNDTRHIISRSCNDTTCEGVLKIEQIDRDQHHVVYTCIIFLAAPYQSTYHSSYIKVYRSEGSSGNNIMVWLTMCIMASAIGILGIMLSVKRNNNLDLVDRRPSLYGEI